MMTPDLSIRHAGPGDLPALLALYGHLVRGEAPPTLEIAEDRLRRLAALDGSGVFIGEVGDQIVASCALAVIPNLTRQGAPYALIENVVTHDLWRRRGFGRRVLEAAIASAWDSGCYKVMLLSGAKDPATLRFYENIGFERSKVGFQIRRLPPREE